MKRQFINLTFIFMAISIVCLPSFAASPGSLDSTFGKAGKAFIPGARFFSGELRSYPDGRTVIVGGRFSFGQMTVNRIKADGSPDNSFSGDGIFISLLGGVNAIAEGVAIQSDGKIVVCGEFRLTQDAALSAFIIRLNFDGTLDTTFDSDGKKTIANMVCRSLAIQNDGKIVGVGNSNGTNLIAFRLNSNGSNDTTFGNNGIVSTTGITGLTSFNAIKIQENGKIVAAGSFQVAEDIIRGVIHRYNTNGSLDTSFNLDGIFIFDTSVSRMELDGLAIDLADNKIYVSGELDGILVAIRLTSSGFLDSSFDNDGIFQNATTTDGSDIALQSDRKIIISAYTGDIVSLIRLQGNGVLDTTFGNNGISKVRESFFIVRNGQFGDGGPKISLQGDSLILGGTISLETSLFLKYNLSKSPTQSGDFDGDGVTDTAVFRPSVGQWFLQRSTNNSFSAFQFGISEDIPIDGDFDGDGKNDLAIFRPSSGIWSFQKSSDGTNFSVTFGLGTDKPITGDFDKDGKTDIAVFRPSTGEWLILRSSSNFSTFSTVTFGLNGDIPIPSERK